MRSDVLANIAVAILRVAFLGVLEAHTCVEWGDEWEVSRDWTKRLYGYLKIGMENVLETIWYVKEMIEHVLSTR